MIVLDSIHCISFPLEKVKKKIRIMLFEVKPKPNFAQERIEFLYEGAKQKRFCDVLFTVGDKSYGAHKVVLSATTEFFESSQNNLNAIFSKYDAEVIDAMIKFCYLGEIYIEQRHKEKLFDLAKRLAVIIPPIYVTVDLSNCLEAFQLTDDPELQKQAMDLILANFEELYKKPNFFDLVDSELIEIIKSDDLIVTSEEDVFRSVELWVNHDKENRKNKLPQLMSGVRLSLIPLEVLVADVTDFFSSCKECKNPVRNAILNVKSPTSQKETARKQKPN
ncbi:kelch-like protein 20 [Arctopsyche grandis]|uniref:kelch-like protein 20 n=1 Tax=Arctopsyche grandis TaxID=121162 RepID=UPI00406D6ED3